MQRDITDGMSKGRLSRVRICFWWPANSTPTALQVSLNHW